MARNFHDTLYKYKVISDLLEKKKYESALVKRGLAKNDKKLRSLNHKLLKKSANLTKELKILEELNIDSIEDYPSMGCYVIFNDI